MTPNRWAFLWGRIAAANRRAFPAAVGADSPGAALPQTFEQIVAHRQAHLTAYQDRAYSQAFREFVDRSAVAIGLSKLMAYKDEYEVARLFVDPQFQREMDAQFERDYRLKLNFAPPLTRRRDSTGAIRKIEP